MVRSTHIRLLAAAPLLAIVGGCAGLGRSPWGPPAAQTAGNARPPQAVAADWLRSPSDELTVRGQSPGYQPQGNYPTDSLPGGYPRGPQAVSGGAPATTVYAQGPYTPAAPTAPYAPYGGPGAAQPPPNYASPPPAGPLPGQSSGLPAPPAGAMSGIPGGISPILPGYPGSGFQPPSNLPPEIPATPTPLDVFVEETRTGQFMFGVTVNSNAGLLGNITISERNFDIMNPPTSWDDLATGQAWHGAGQGFRIQAQPGTVLQNYSANFTEPYFLGSNVSFDASVYYFNRLYFDWTETRVGGRLAWGYRLTPDLSIAGAFRAEDVDIFNPRVRGVPELEAVLGHSTVSTARVNLTHDTRDIPFAPTQGHLIMAAYEQAFGEFSFPRGDFEWAQYFMVRQRPDGSGRHTVGLISRVGVAGPDTPVFENYFAGGYATLRGFQFRGASPKDMGVIVGGRFQWINSAEYYFPLTADNMIRGTVFCDFGTVEQNVALHPDQFRVAPGFGFRINVPAMGPAPLAFDFAFPVASASTDHKQLFSFFMGASR